MSNSAQSNTNQRHARNLFLYDQMKSKTQSLYYRQLLIEENLALVSTVLAQFRPYTEDQFQIGCLGLIRAVDTFDPARGVAFSSYACFCIGRELHMEHKKQSDSFEVKMAEYLYNLDALLKDSEGEETALGDLVEDPAATEDFMRMLSDFQLDWIFDCIIDPAIAKAQTNSQAMDVAKWAQLERMYLIELSEIYSQKARINLSAIARELGVSTTFIKNKHEQVIKQAQQLYAALQRKG